MSWAVGYDSNWKRDIGYGVPAYCDHPGCLKEIDRGLSHVCGGQPYGGERGCGLYFCSDHLRLPASNIASQLCDRCYPRIKKPFAPTADHPTWTQHKITDPSWKQWRIENGIEERV